MLRTKQHKEKVIKRTRVETNKIKFAEKVLKHKIEQLTDFEKRTLCKKRSDFHYLPVFRTPVLDKTFGLIGLNELHKGDFWISIPMIAREFKGLPVNILSLDSWKGDYYIIVNLVTFKYLVIQVDFMTDIYEQGNVRLSGEKFTRKVKYAKQLKQLLGFK